MYGRVVEGLNDLFLFVVAVFNEVVSLDLDIKTPSAPSMYFAEAPPALVPCPSIDKENRQKRRERKQLHHAARSLGKE